MELAAAVSTLLTLLNTATTFIGQASQISAIVQKAQGEGRTTLTPEEWAVVTGADDASRKQLADAINAALKLNP